MSEAIDWMKLLPSVLQIGGTTYSAAAQRKAGQAAHDAANFRAAQLEDAALAAPAMAQRQAYNEQRYGKYVTSSARARSAASGALGPDIANIIAGLDSESAYRTMAALYGGEDRARNYRLNADAARVSGQSAKDASRVNAMTTLLSGGAKTLFDRFGARNRPSDSDPFGGAGDGGGYDKTRALELEE